MEKWHVQTKNKVQSWKSRKSRKNRRKSVGTHRVHAIANLMEQSNYDGLIRPPAFYLYPLIWYGQPYTDIMIKRKSTEIFYTKSMSNASVRIDETCRRRRGL